MFTGKIAKVMVDVKAMGAGEQAVAGKARAEAAKKMENQSHLSAYGRQNP